MTMNSENETYIQLCHLSMECPMDPVSILRAFRNMVDLLTCSVCEKLIRDPLICKTNCYRHKSFCRRCLASLKFKDCKNICIDVIAGCISESDDSEEDNDLIIDNHSLYNKSPYRADCSRRIILNNVICLGHFILSESLQRSNCDEPSWICVSTYLRSLSPFIVTLEDNIFQCDNSAEVRVDLVHKADDRPPEDVKSYLDSVQIDASNGSNRSKLSNRNLMLSRLFEQRNDIPKKHRRLSVSASDVNSRRKKDGRLTENLTTLRCSSSTVRDNINKDLVHRRSPQLIEKQKLCRRRSNSIVPTNSTSVNDTDGTSIETKEMSNSDVDSAASLKAKVCRCGTSALPVSLMCCGLRCTCYAEDRACMDSCNCRGCRNPFRPYGKKVASFQKTAIKTQ